MRKVKALLSKTTKGEMHMAHSGSGTQTDPYIVDTWEDFKYYSTYRNCYVVLDPNAENKVIDLNDTEDRGGMKSSLNIYAYVDGSGWEIRNYVAKNGYYITFHPDNVKRLCKNLHFRNIIGMQERVFYGSFHFEDCSFSGLMLNDATLFRSVLTAGGTFNRCGMHLQLWGSSTHAVLSNQQMTNCHIHLEGRAPVSIITPNTLTCLQDCLLTGALRLDGGTLVLSGAPQDRNTVTAMAVTGTGTVDLTANAEEVCIVDTNLLDTSLTVNLTGTNRLGLTTEQMQDPVYLLETVGFPIIAPTA